MRAFIAVAVFPRSETRLPHCGINDARVVGVDLDVGAAGVGINVKHLLPRHTAVSGAEDTTLFVRTVRMAENRGEQLARVMRIDSKLRNLLPVAQAKMLPGLARVSGPIYAVANGEVGAPQAFAASHVDDIAVGSSDGDRADRLRRLAIEDRLPGAPVIVALPNTAVALTNVEDVWLADNPSSGPRATTAKWSNHSPVQVRFQFRRLLPVGGCNSGECNETKGDGMKLHCTETPDGTGSISSS